MDCEINRTSTQSRVAVLQVQGRLDAKGAQALRWRCAEVAGEGRNLIINLSGVNFIGSAGIGALLAVTEEFQDQAGSMRIADLSPVVQDVVKLMGLERLLAIDSDEGTALARLKAA